MVLVVVVLVERLVVFLKLVVGEIADELYVSINTLGQIHS